MDRLQLAFFKLAARERFGRLRRHAFQDWFCEIMQLAYPTDFEAVRVTQGDGGIDGFRLSTACVYQVYAPRDQSTTVIVGKIGRDFETAHGYLAARNVVMRAWTFVHNDFDGLAAEVVAKLAQLSEGNPGVTIQRWAFDMVWETLKLLSAEQLAELFGAGPTEANIEHLTIPEIADVINRLQRQAPPAVPDLTIPDADKLEHNKLSSESIDWLRLGRTRERLVEMCLNAAQDPTAGERIAEAYRRKYAELRGSNAEPDDIFSILWEFSGGSEFTLRSQQAATAVMAYFFNKCDIFENTPEPT